MNPTSYFSRKSSNCPKNKIVHNFLIKNPNQMNQTYPRRKKYNLKEKNKIKFKVGFMEIFLLTGVPCVDLHGHNFCSQAPIAKNIIFPQRLSIFLSSKKVSK
jgi:hypothetical protein